MSINGAINGFVDKAKGPANVAVWLVAALAWYQLSTAIDAVALNASLTRCEVAEMRLYLQDGKPFRNDCSRIIQAWVDGKIADIKPGQ